MDNPDLKYRFLADFDRDMIALAKQFRLLDSKGPDLLYEHSDDKVLAFMRAGLVFVFNFHAVRSHIDYRFMFREIEKAQQGVLILPAHKSEYMRIVRVQNQRFARSKHRIFFANLH